MLFMQTQHIIFCYMVAYMPCNNDWMMDNLHSCCQPWVHEASIHLVSLHVEKASCVGIFFHSHACSIEFACSFPFPILFFLSHARGQQYWHVILLY
jgi:hypothetical protein